MPWRSRELGSTADAAFEATGRNLEELFCSAVDAVVGTMVSDPRSVLPREERPAGLRAESLDMLLFELLGLVVFHKDAGKLLLRLGEASVRREPEGWSLEATLRGERIDAARHDTLCDVKAVTLQDFRVSRFRGGWRAEVVLDV
jgi:SHS2 domain-containing protein